jgi:hypothetical protein
MQHKNQASKIKKTPLELQKDPHSSRPSSVGTIPSTRKDIQLRIPAEENELPGEKTLGSRNACYVKKILTKSNAIHGTITQKKHKVNNTCTHDEDPNKKRMPPPQK